MLVGRGEGVLSRWASEWASRGDIRWLDELATEDTEEEMHFSNPRGQVSFCARDVCDASSHCSPKSQAVRDLQDAASPHTLCQCRHQRAVVDSTHVG